tara:strand:+ start:185 stop:580 length:396 start_codon:yes stop_codon:yes gene_type:complete
MKMKSDDRLHELIDKLEEVYIEDSISDIRLLDAVKEVIDYYNDSFHPPETEKTIINDRPSVYFDGEKYHTIYHEYYGDNAYDKRKAVVFRKNDSYGVVMIDDGKIIEERLLKGHSEEYAEDCAENFVVGVI